MAAPTFDRKEAARVIAEAILVGDKAACQKHGITDRTLRRWRKRCETDTELSAEVQTKSAIAEKKLDLDWASDIPMAIKDCVNFIKRAAHKCDAKDPDAVHSIAGAMKLLTDVAIQKQLVDVRLARQAGQAGTPARPGAPTGNVVPIERTRAV